MSTTLTLLVLAAIVLVICGAYYGHQKMKETGDGTFIELDSDVNFTVTEHNISFLDWRDAQRHQRI